MKKTLEVINELEKEKLIKTYAIGGAIAALKWIEPFFTRDLDIFIIPVQKTKDGELIVLTPIYDYLASKGYLEWKGQWLMIEGIPVEFIPAEGLIKESVENAVEIDFEGVKTRVITPEYLIALFLTAGRDKDLIKIRMLLDQAPVEMKKLNDILQRYGLQEKFASLRRTIR